MGEPQEPMTGNTTDEGTPRALTGRARRPGCACGSLLATALLTSAIASGVASAEEHEGELGEHEAYHTIGLFVGNTTEDTREGRRDGATLGLEYEYRFSARFGVGLTLEHVFGDFDEDLAVVPFALHEGPWKLYVGAGVEYDDGEYESLLRLGVEYGFHFDKVEVSPQIDVDFVDGEDLLVLGVVFAVEF